jgi:WD40 repeat protein
MAPNSRRKKPEILEKNQLRIEKIQTKKRQRREENEHKRLSRNETNEKVDKNEDDVAEEEGEEEEDDNEKRNNNNVTKQQQQQQQQQFVQAEPIMCARKDGMYFLLAYGTKVAAFSIDKDRTGWFLTTKDDASTGDESGGFKLRKIEKEQAKEATLEDYDDEVTIIKDATDKIRTMAFSDCGEYFAVAGDDKRVRIYALVKKKKTEEQLRKEEEKKLKPNYELLLPYMYQECLYYAAPLNVRVANKKVTSVAFTSDSKHVVYGDKYGDVRVCEVLPPPQAEKQQQQKEEHTENNNNNNNNNTSNNRKKTKNGDNDVDGDAETGVFDTLLLGHTGTIITSICVTKPNADKGVEEFVCTADREGKIRVTRMPPANLRSSIEGSGFDIQSFCFGHVGFVSQIRYAFADTIVSGGGDGTLRVWNCLTGQQIAQTVQVSSSPIKDICVLVVNDRDKSLVVMSIHEDSTVYETHLILMSSQETTSKLVNRRHGDRLTVDAVCGVGIDTCRDSRFEVYAAVQEENGKMIAKALYHYPQDVLSELNVSVVEEKANVEGIRASEFFENQY